MIARKRLGLFLPVSALALVAALGAAACDGGGDTSPTGNGGNGGNGGSGAGSSGECGTTCAGDTPVCDPESKTCVGCLTGADCGQGQYCAPSTQKCTSGCDEDADCTSPLVCDTASHLCVGCSEDSQCDAGSVCNENGQCVPGCTDSQPCSGGLACCEGACTDLQADPQSCGACGDPCPKIPGAAEICVGGQCQMGACDMGANGNYADCNLNPDDGCEWDLDIFGPCTCTPGETQECYTGPAGTKDIGTCVAGVAECQPDGANWGPCNGQITPVFDACSDGKDNDCNGTVDDAKDLDGDGWTPCDGDCCDVMNADGCADPGLVNPGAFDVAGNMVDDDCDGTMDNPQASCDGNLPSNSGIATDYAKAIDLCGTTVENPALKKDKKWGVISGTFSRADGTNMPTAESKSIRAGFGSGVTPLAGSKLAILSTGTAAAQATPNNMSPNYVAPQGGDANNITSGLPADWLAANGGLLPNPLDCDPPAGGSPGSATFAKDPVMLKLRVRVPTNAKSFDVSTIFYTSEYPEWVCSPYNDFFVALLTSGFVPGMGQVGNPTDKNLAVYSANGTLYPVGVNLVKTTDLFKQCKDGPIGCAVGDNTNYTGCTSTTQLAGTGFDVVNPLPQFGNDPGYCGASNLSGGATGWLTTTGNVVPGEVMEIRFAMWDTGDGYYDSTVLLDNFVWSLEASEPGTHE